jgi:hypothetical protein
MEEFGKPDIFNTDQGSLFTSQAFTGLADSATGLAEGALPFR